MKIESPCEDCIHNALESTGVAALSPQEKTHFDSCSVCQTEVLQFLEIRSLFSKVPLKEPSFSSLQLVIQKARGWAQKPSLWSLLVTQVEAFFHSSWNWAPAFMVLLLAVSVGSFSENVFKKQVDNNYSLNSSIKSKPRYSLVGSGQQMISPLERVSLSQASLNGEETSETNFEFQGLPGQSADDLKTALLEEDADNLLMRGRRFKSMGRVDLALKDFETIFHYYPNYTYIGDVLMYRSQCYAFQGNFDKAMESLEVYMKKDPSKAGLLQSMINQLRLEQAKN
jgi:tetratricopeptide (TPR) repeat protein